ncbi:MULTISPECIES: F0F1 ATP synthase subunit epsilon [Actinosynnema]|uniref:ATP synthase epsilon chain n=1 Tax=Actinosynnema pretiosum TaxID=42197 RepID=A0A290ZHJ3_9PSEU|nr:F0F1 ATP synthase subunit epsilon [Actinosynnema pretiosum]ATE58476.1 F0F1 ATP synthase subunit epsilon [Actinosynnema pretiosum]
MAEMTVQLVAVERRLWSGSAKSVVAKTTEGEIGILPGHEPMLAQLVEGGIVKVRTTDGEVVAAAVHGGFLSVTAESVSVLAEEADLAREIDVDAAKRELESAEGSDRLKAQARIKAAGHTA